MLERTRTVRRPLCRVESCINGNSKTRNRSERVFHFPRGQGPTRNAAIEWLRFVNDTEELERFLTTGNFSPKCRAYSVCERHFAPHQFVTPDRTRLNRGAVPLFHTPEDALTIDMLPPRCKNDVQSTIESHGGSTSSGDNNTDGTGRENQIRLLKEEIRALVEIDDSHLNWTSHNTIDVRNVVGDTLSDSGYLCGSLETNTHVIGNNRTGKRGLEEIDMVFDHQEAETKKPKLSLYEKLIKNLETHSSPLDSDEPGKVILPVKSYSKIKIENTSDYVEVVSNESTDLPGDYFEAEPDESTNLPSDYVEVQSELPCENDLGTVSSEIELSVKWEDLPEEMCRLCASKDEHPKQPINTWVKLMKQLIPSTVAINDGLPQYICKPCAEKLYMCITIKQSFIASYKKLKLVFTANEENIETEPDLMSDYPDGDNTAISDSEDDNNPTCDSVKNSAFTQNTSDGKIEEVSPSSKSKVGKKRKKKVKKYSFICIECEELFYSSKCLKNHMKTKHDTLNCEYCNRCFTETSALEEHVRTHTAETQFKCQCGTQVNSIKQLKEHLINHKPMKYNCSNCCKSFRNFFEMKHHEKGHKKFICEICGKQMKSKAYLSVHMRRHTGEKPYQCECCGLSFLTSDRYYIHKYKKHSNEQYHCEICGKILYTEYSFERHKLGHEKGKQYKCDVCLQDFRYEFSKDLHQRAKCSTCFCVVCNLIFSDAQELIEHRSKEHLEEEVASTAFAYRSERTFDCNLCSKAYKKSYSLANHIQRHHRKREKSSVLSPVKKKCVQKKPRKIFNCTKCEKKFKTCKALKLHSASYHEDDDCTFSCSYCKEKFVELNALIAHESQHLKEKVFSCCGWIFSSKADFVRHRRLHSQNISEIPFEGENYEETTELNIVLPSHVLT